MKKNPWSLILIILLGLFLTKRKSGPEEGVAWTPDETEGFLRSARDQAGRGEYLVALSMFRTFLRWATKNQMLTQDGIREAFTDLVIGMDTHADAIYNTPEPITTFPHEGRAEMRWERLRQERGLRLEECRRYQSIKVLITTMCEGTIPVTEKTIKHLQKKLEVETQDLYI